MTQRTVKKSLAGLEDLTLGEGTENQSRNGGTYPITQIRYVYPVNSLAELNALDTDLFVKARLYTGDIETPPVDYEFIAGVWEQTSLGGGSSVASLAEVQATTPDNLDVIYWDGDTETWKLDSVNNIIDLTADYDWTGNHTFSEFITVTAGIKGFNTLATASFSLLQNLDGAPVLGSITKEATIATLSTVTFNIAGTSYTAFHANNIKDAVIPINPQTGTTYTLGLGDRGSLVTQDNVNPIITTVPLNATVPFEIGTPVSLAEIGAGQVTIFPTPGVTLLSELGLKIKATNGFATLLKIAVDTWLVTGSLET